MMSLYTNLVEAGTKDPKARGRIWSRSGVVRKGPPYFPGDEGPRARGSSTSGSLPPQAEERFSPLRCDSSLSGCFCTMCGEHDGVSWSTTGPPGHERLPSSNCPVSYSWPKGRRG
jgi:hypothetical protein